MKLAILGVAAAIAGLVLGVDGLLLSGGLWIVFGLAIWAIFSRHEGRPGASGAAGTEAATGGRDPRAPRGGPLGTVMVLAVGLGSLAIGIFEIGFAAGSAWRWAPVALGGLATFVALLAIPVRLSGARLEAARRAGATKPATVTIEGKRQTGTYVNEQPRIEFDLLVEAEGLPAYRVKKKATVPHAALGEIGIGDGFEAEVDPADEGAIAIAWNAPIEGGAGADSAARLERLDDLRRRGLIDAEEHEAQRRRIIGSV